VSFLWLFYLLSTYSTNCESWKTANRVAEIDCFLVVMGH